MKLSHAMAIKALSDFEIWGPISPIPTSHPPSLKNPIHVKQDWLQDGWHKNDPKEKKAQARKDLAVTMQRVLRQRGKPTVAHTAVMPVFPSVNSSQIQRRKEKPKV